MIATRSAAGSAPIWLIDQRLRAALALLLTVGLTALILNAPWIVLALLIMGLATWGLWRYPHAAAPALIVCMGSVKVNYYAGFVTVFPEYGVLALALLAWVGGRLSVRSTDRENGLVVAWAVFCIAGALSFVNAVAIPKVLGRAILIALEGAIFFVTLYTVDSRARVERALRWLRWTSFFFAAFGVLQIVGMVLGFDPSPRFLRRFGNPEFHYGVGSPRTWLVSKLFSANSFFNDSNILAGYLAAAIALSLAWLLNGVRRGDRMRRLLVRAGHLLMLGVCLVLTMSRSGVLAAVLGAATVLALMPETLRVRRFWVTIGLTATAALVIPVCFGAYSTMLLVRLALSFDSADWSTQVHSDALGYGLELLGRYPITGVGLGNFGHHYAAQRDVMESDMMSHSAPLTYFAEGGILTGVAFLVLIIAIARRPVRALMDRALGDRDPELRGWVAGMTGALAALAIGNTFYDYSMRTFIWVFAALAVASARQLERARSG